MIGIEDGADRPLHVRTQGLGRHGTGDEIAANRAVWDVEDRQADALPGSS